MDGQKERKPESGITTFGMEIDPDAASLSQKERKPERGITTGVETPAATGVSWSEREKARKRDYNSCVCLPLEKQPESERGRARKRDYNIYRYHLLLQGEGVRKRKSPKAGLQLPGCVSAIHWQQRSERGRARKRDYNILDNMTLDGLLCQKEEEPESGITTFSII
ncbi:hypothetical protein [Dictyobacter arantiisoli]|uniref:hypothetical protein n=1 Tax=Dictyobacter arantiisoli TaxID=2014874 RepID=UPI003FCE6722